MKSEEPWTFTFTRKVLTNSIFSIHKMLKNVYCDENKRKKKYYLEIRSRIHPKAQIWYKIFVFGQEYFQIFDRDRNLSEAIRTF